MSNSATSEKTSSTMRAYIRIAPSSGTLQSSTDHVLAGTSIAVPTSVIVAEAESIMRDVHTNYLYFITLPEIGNEYSDEEELEWDTLFAQPHVQAGLSRLAEEARRQILAGKTVEGGFAVE
ncbi:MAG: hypothetical protein E6I91_19380 [Chloroflexi bacterium]|nr:MAG: hypothetical protein E6I91_19380 [Chloroflexota bacterium]